MKISIGTTEFKKAVKAVDGTVSSKNVMPVLQHIHLTASKDRIILRSTDLEVSTSVSIPATVDVHGSVCLPAAILGELVSSSASEGVVINLIDNGKVSLSIGKAAFVLAGLPGEDFPEENSNRGALVGGFQVNGKSFAESMAQVTFAINSSDTTRPILTSMLMECDGNVVRMVATDGTRLQITGFPLPGGSTFKTLIPIKAAKLIKSMVGNAKGDVTVTVYENEITVADDATCFSCRPFVGEFPAYISILKGCKDSTTMTLTTKKEPLLMSLKKVSTMSEAGYLSIVTGKNTVAIASISPGGNAVDSFPASCPEGIIMRINGKYLIESLNSIPAEGIEITFAESRMPLGIKGSGLSAPYGIVMPAAILEEEVKLATTALKGSNDLLSEVKEAA